MAKTTTGVNGNNNDMYPQSRGTNGRFGKRQAPTTANPLTHYVYKVNGVDRNFEQRNIKTQSGRSISANTFNSAVNNAGAKGARRYNY